MTRTGNQTKHRPQAAEFSRPVSDADITADGLDLEIEADPRERRALARRLGVPVLSGLRARVRLIRRDSGEIVVSGDFAAVVTQVCVVSLERFEQTLEEPFERRFRPAGAPEPAGGGQRVADIDPFAEEPPEPIGSGAVDVGEIVAEELVLALDPFPRKPGAALDEAAYAGPGRDEEEAASPFAALERLKGKR